MTSADPGMGMETTMALDRGVVLSLAVALRTAEMYRADNAAALAVVDRLSEHLERRAALGPLELVIRNRCVFAAGRRVRLTAADYPRFVYLMRVFDEWGIRGLTFQSSLSTSQLLDFLWAAANDRAGSPEVLLDRLNPLVLNGLGVIEDEEAARSREHKGGNGPGGNGARGGEADGGGGAGIDPTGDAPEAAYLRALTAAQKAGETLREGGTMAARRIRRITQSIVDEVMGDPLSLLALTTIKDYDVYLLSHSINVAILSTLLGFRLGLSKSQLGELVLAAFLHDIGKTRLPEELVGKPASLTDEEWVEMKRHPELGALVLIGQRHPTRSMMRAVRVAFEHHMDFDLGGYPHVAGLSCASLFSLIIMVVDRYDALTTPRPYRRHNFTPPEAIALMAANAGSGLDPVVLRHFIELMGIYPVGTLLRLVDGAVGVVAIPPREDSPSNRPTVRLLHDNSTVDLAARDADGCFLHEVVEVVNPGNVGQVPAVSPDRLVLREDPDLD